MGTVRTEDEEYVNPYASDETPAYRPEPESEAEPEILEPVNLDSFTGNPVNRASSELVTLSASCSYDREQDEFIYQVNNSAGSTFTSNVPDGAMVQQTVALRIPDTLMPVLYRNGNVVETPDYDNIKETGIYSLSFNRDGEVSTGMFTFTIIGSVLGKTYTFVAPSLFPIRYASGPNGAIAYSDFEAPLSEDGEYTFTYANSVIGKSYTVSFLVDNVAPELRIEGPNENGVARCPVLLYDYNTEDTLEIYKDNVKITNRLQLTEVGTYMVIVRDAAGNYNTYNFIIRTYLDTMSWIFMGALTLLAAAAVFFIVFERKRFSSN